MNWKKTVFQNFKLYAITDLQDPDLGVLGKIDQAYRGGADIVQLRSKKLPDAALCRIGIKIRQIADHHKRLFFVNDRPDLALAFNADGIHLGQEDLPIRVVREILSRTSLSLWIGKSTHNVLQAKEAEQEGADYIGVGPIYETPTKSGRAAIGLHVIQEVKSSLSIPLVAIGGIRENNASEVIQAGAERIATVRAIFQSEDVYEATKKLRREIERHTSPHV